MLKNKEYKSRIDTIEIKDKVSNRENLDIEIKGYELIRMNEKAELKCKLNPNNLHYAYDTEYKLSKTKENINELLNLITVINKDEVEMNRIDICTDVNVNYTENIKLLDLLHRCLVANFKNGKGWDTIDKKDLEKSNLRFANRSFNIEFYDKKKESDNTSLYDTRLEIRALRVKSQSYEFHIDRCIDLYKATANNLKKVEKMVVEILIKKWEKEKIIQPNLKFTTFVYKYSHYFYTMNILKEVYRATELRGAINGWLRDFRKTYTLELYTKKEIEDISKKIIKSLKEYKKM